MLSFPLRQRAGVPRRGIGTHPLRSSTACVRDAAWRVFRLVVLTPSEHGLRLRVSAGLRPASPTTGVLDGSSAGYRLGTLPPQPRTSAVTWPGRLPQVSAMQVLAPVRPLRRWDDGPRLGVSVDPSREDPCA